MNEERPSFETALPAGDESPAPATAAAAAGPEPTEAATPAEPAAPRRRAPRGSRRRKDDDVAPPAAEEAGAGAVPDANPADVLSEIGHAEVRALGEPVPLHRGDPPAPPETIVVPEAFLEAAPLEEAREGRDRRRGRGRGRDRAGEAPAAAPAPVAAVPEPAAPFPDLVLVAEALLETVPADWAEEDAARGLPALVPAEGRRGRGRGRGRGRERDRERPEEARPAEPTPLPATGPIILGRTDDDRERDRREIRTERDYKEILINTGDRETRIAVLEAGRLVELHVEREERVVGNVCKGRVSNVLPGMDCAFVDIGLDRNAFLYVGDILYEDKDAEGGPRRTSRDVKIKDLAKPGQEMLVQVVKGPRGTKGARVSTKMSIPGRYLVLMPEGGDSLGVSRKVEDPRERERLRRIVDQIRPKGFGLIIRTEAEGHSETELKQDLEYLVATWGKIQEKTRRAHAPALIHKDLGIVLKTIRDLFGQDVDKLILDDREEYEKVVDTLTELSPDLVDRVQLHDDAEPLFNRYNLEEEIDRLLRRKVWLRNGAYLLLDTTEALTTIDVNTGKFVGTSSLAETILKTNMDAVEEIARQLRLRDIGGMIVLDFIDMASSRDRQLVMRKLEEAFRKDRTRTKIAHISPLGLVEMTRKRTADNVTDVMTEPCPYCQGRGRVWSAETMAIQVEREVLRLCAKQDVEAILIYTNPDVAAWLIGAEGESVERLERTIRRPVYVRARHDFHIEKFEVQPGDMLELEQQLFPYHGGHVVEAVVQKLDLITPPRSAAWADGYFVDLANGARLDGQRTRVRLTDVRRSFALGEPVAPASAVDRSEPI